jgi:hypothetical protein
MSKKQLDTTAIENELRGGSAFFPSYRKAEQSPSPAPEAPSTEDRQPKPEPEPKPEKEAEKPEDTAAIMLARKHASKTASMLALSPDIIEAVRRIVRKPGKEEVLYVRLSREEKDRLSDVTYTYKRQGMKTSDNELMRVAINMLLEDYKVSGEQSLLARILAKLHS